ncbi:MAG: molybdopterin biosynthesis protein, partial [Acidimicrobiia bacterium]|nr:molybdopterin biosynthesis protein [Acidimicrobiia bacterium]
SAATAALGSTTDRLPLAEALGRVLAEEVRAVVDVPGFDRSNMDGFAVRAEDTFGAEESEPIALMVADVHLEAGAVPPADLEVTEGVAVRIATGGVIPRGADAVLMVEHTRPDGQGILASHPVPPGGNISFAGSDIGRGEVVARPGQVLGARETGVLASVGCDEVSVVRRPRVLVVSTGDEIVAPGGTLGVGDVFDSNQRILLDTLAELGADPVPGGIVPDEEARLRAALESAVADELIDLVLLSGGTSKGDGDLNARLVHQLASERSGPGVVAHGVALKPGKPLLLSVIESTPVVVLPGFPTSAIFTFHEFVAPLIRRLAGRPEGEAAVVRARLPLRVDGAAGRTTYALVDLVHADGGVAAYPLGAGSGSVTAFARADGFIRIPADVEYLEASTEVTVRLIDPSITPADLVVIGSHCIGLDHLLGRLAEEGFRVKAIPVGSRAGLAALGRGEGDLAGTHLLDPETGVYNQSFLPDGATLHDGYGRRQGVAFRPGTIDLDGLADEELGSVLGAGDLRMVNRNPGAGTRVLIDALLGGARPPGYLHQARTHHGVAAAIAQGRADWGVTIDTVAGEAGLDFRFLADERFDLAVRDDRAHLPAVGRLLELLAAEDVRAELRSRGFVD